MNEDLEIEPDSRDAFPEVKLQVVLNGDVDRIEYVQRVHMDWNLGWAVRRFSTGLGFN